MEFQVQEDIQYNQNGYTYGDGPVRPSNESHETLYNTREQAPDYSYTTPAPKTKHKKTKSRDKELDTVTKTTDRKRKRNSPAELDMSLVHANQDRDVMMSDAPMLHSGLTGGLNRLLARPEFPPSPELSGDYAENSPLSPMKRAKQGTSKALMRAQREWEIQQEKERKEASMGELQKEKERGRDRERKERKASTALAKIKPKKRRDDSPRERRRHRETDKGRKRQYSSSPSPAPERKLKAIGYDGAQDDDNGALIVRGNGALIVRGNGELAPVLTGEEARAELFMSFINKGPESERGMSVNKALKRYHRERYDRWDREMSKADEEKELWKTLRLKKNDRGEIVLFYAPAEN
jgi:cell growth-regulating nucleolar protein